MNTDSARADSSWLRSHAGRRYWLELSAVVALKLFALTILYFAFIAPQARVDTSPASILEHVLGAPSNTEPPP